VLFFSKLNKTSRLERLRQEESKERIKLNNGGGIFVISTDEKNTQRSIESAMGAGASVVVLDEGCLVSDRTEATVYRMIAGKSDAMYVKIGNPFYALPPFSHFHQSWFSGDYHRIYVDYERAMAEGRLAPEFVAEAKRKPLFDVLFGCEFPSTDVADADGYRPLLKAEDIRRGVTVEAVLAAYLKAKEKNPDCPRIKLGVDVGGGGDWTTATVRWHDLAALAYKGKTADTMQAVVMVEEMLEKLGVAPEDCAIDDIGVGKGASDRLREKGLNVSAVSVGDPAMNDRDTFSNLKAELTWAMRSWALEPDSRLCSSDDWLQLTWVRWRTVSDRRVQVEAKERLRARHGASPDAVDSLMLTFYERPFVGFA
jgi:hypothetical protein